MTSKLSIEAGTASIGAVEAKIHKVVDAMWRVRTTAMTRHMLWEAAPRLFQLLAKLEPEFRPLESRRAVTQSESYLGHHARTSNAVAHSTRRHPTMHALSQLMPDDREQHLPRLSQHVGIPSDIPIVEIVVSARAPRLSDISATSEYPHSRVIVLRSLSSPMLAWRAMVVLEELGWGGLGIRMGA
ncbi:hypothetical protein FA95DRAFT_1669510 [Auriscalpium vulgare]|uniref:Uncharacterized protein n=1 Tax=Auriscalpium vulgare TaxID=40419 RepID=A0ACB8R1K9_9AGAM|nr:hypothetical protein FA95DRAFT_1669510 [Auriscalpium vulgare]